MRGLNAHYRTKFYSVVPTVLLLLFTFSCGGENKTLAKEDFTFFGKVSVVYANDGNLYLFLTTEEEQRYGLLYDEHTKYVNMLVLGDGQVSWATGGKYGIIGDIEIIDGREYIDSKTVMYFEDTDLNTPDG